MLNKNEILKTLMDEKQKLFAFAWTLLRDPHSSDDVFQEMVIKALNSESHFKSLLHLKNWSRTVIRNQCLDLIKQNKKQTFLTDELIDKIEHDFQERDLSEENHSLLYLKDCISHLTEQTQEILKLRYSSNIQANEMADILNKKTDAIYKVLQRAHQSLKVCIQNKGIAQNT